MHLPRITLTRARPPLNQRLLPSLERSQRLDRVFKRGIALATIAIVVGLVGATSVGRSMVLRLQNYATHAFNNSIGLPPDRSETDTAWKIKRAEGIEQTAVAYRKFFEKKAKPPWQRILRTAGMAPEDVLLRWANYDWTVALSPQVFLPDDTGRSYRMRPNQRTFWARDHSLPDGLVSFFALPDTPEIRSALAVANEEIMPESYQTTNSWGCRGPEPDLDATARVLVIGDSFMQGIFVADDQTPPECLARTLGEAWGVSVSVLNTGHIGYSLEQYYFTLKEYIDRFRPHFVIVSICGNDFGDGGRILYGGGDFVEGKYWLNEIQQTCRTKQVVSLVVPVPFEVQLYGPSNQGHFPGRVSDISDSGSFYYLNPVAAFTDEHLRLLAEARKVGKRPRNSPLYNGHLDDGHLSPLGAALWAREVGRRVTLLYTPPEKQAAHPKANMNL